MAFDFSPNKPSLILKTDLMSKWITQNWVSTQSRDDYVIVITAEICVNGVMLEKFKDDISLAEKFAFLGYELFDNPDFLRKSVV